MISKARCLGLSLLVYGTFTLICAVVHGFQPDLHIDHIAYLKRADNLLQQLPNGEFWRGFESRNGFAILLASLYKTTGDHIISLKVLLAAMSVAWLFGLENWFRAIGLSGVQSRGAALLGGLTVNFGAPQWGVASFSDALHRTLVMPALFFVLGWYWRNINRDRRLMAFPLVAMLCLVHLGAAYLLFTLSLFECWRVASTQGIRLGGGLRLACALSAAVAILFSIQAAGLALSPEAATRLIPTLENGGQALSISPADAWTVELAALRWRNFPPSFATVLAMLASAGPLVMFGLAGAYWSRKSSFSKLGDRPMFAFAVASVVAALGWQVTLFILRRLLPIYPLNFEEIRAIVWVVPCLIYFGVRGLETTAADRWRRLVLVTGIALTLVQPAKLVVLLPQTYREALLEIAAPQPPQSPNDMIRSRLARQWLHLPTTDPRFYYDAIGLIHWLRDHTDERNRVLTDRDECRLGPAKVIGAPTGFLEVSPRSPEALAWLALTRDLQSALLADDRPRLMELAQAAKADFIVIRGRHPDAAYADDHYSVIAVGNSNPN